MKKALSFIIFIITTCLSFAQIKDSKKLYEQSFEEQLQMLKGEKPIDFKRAVFITENAYSDGQLNYKAFCDEIAATAKLLKNFIKLRGIEKYRTAGNYAVFTYMMDTTQLNNYKPYTYDFDDFMGERDWKNMFVTKLMKTRKGNCHSLPYYYKILCDEVGASSSLALGPNHVYIKHVDEYGKWVNVELTNASFPRDEWIMQQMDISFDAIKSESYMAPLSDKEDIAMTMFDLAYGYKLKYGYDSFVLDVLNIALINYPRSICLLAEKANLYKNIIEEEKKKSHPDPDRIKGCIETYKRINDQIDALGYKEETKEHYEAWVKALEEEKAKRNGYENK